MSAMQEHPMEGPPCTRQTRCPDCLNDLTFDGQPRCVGTSAQSGHRCGRAAHPGTTVCVSHGAAGIRKRAQLRLIDLVGPATEKLEEVLTTSTDDRVVLKAVEMVFDRTGLPARVEVGSETVKALLLERLLAMREQAQQGEFTDVEFIEVPAESQIVTGVLSGTSVETDTDSVTKTDTPGGS